MDQPPLASLCPSFRSAPAEGLLYLSESHRHVLDAILAGLDKGGILILTGDAGTGKTTLGREVAHLRADRRLGWIGQTRAQLLDLPHQVREVCGPVEDGKPCLLIVDEAQALPDEALDHLAGLPVAVSVLLIGPEELTARLGKSRHDTLRTRIGGRFHLSPFGEQETADYIAHRFRVSGCACHAGVEVFDEDGVGRIHALSGGIPRVINHLVQACLFEARGLPGGSMDGAFIRSCLSEMAADGRLAYLLPASLDKPANAPTAGIGPAAAPVTLVPPPVSALLPASPLPAAVGPAPSLSARRPVPSPATPSSTAPAPAPAPARNEPSRRVRGNLRLAGIAAALTLGLIAAPQLYQRFAPPVSATLAELDHALVEAPPDAGALLAQALNTGEADAAQLYARAALWGNQRAAYYLGQLYETGIGIELDLARAVAWYAAAPDIAGARMRLAELGAEQPGPPDAPAPAPVPASHMLIIGGQTELHWRSPFGATRFRVEFVAEGESDVRHLDTTLDAALIPQQVARWRVMVLQPDGTAGTASGWSHPLPQEPES